MEAAPSEMNTIPNGKGHETAEGTTSSAKSPVDNSAQETVSSCTQNSTETAPSAAQTATETVPNSTESTTTNRTEDTEANLAESHEFLSPVDDKKTPRFTDFEGKTSFGMSVFNLGNAIMGSGILGLAYAMANTGIVLFLFLLTAVAGLSSYSIHLLLKSSGIVGIRAYEQLGYRAFGTPGKMAAGIAITLQNIGAMSSYLYIIKYELPLVIQAFCGVDKPSGEWYLNGNYLVIIVSISVILPLALMKQLGYLGYTSGFSLSCMVFFLIAVIYKKFQLPCPFEEFSFNRTITASLMNASVIAEPRGGIEAVVDPSCVPKMFNINSKTAYTIPILAFAFVCHPEVLPIYTELRNPTKKKMQHVSNISIAVMYTMYFLAALFGYLTFYERVESELLHTYSRIDPYDTLILCVRVAVLTAVTLTVPIVLFPVRRAIQQMLFPNKTFFWPRHIAIAFVLLTIINLLVIFAPNILGIFGFIGATSAPCLIFIFPAVFYIRIVPKEDEPLRSPPKILAICFAILGILFMIMSLSFIIIDWTTGSSKASSGH
ncbi:sodium-coupled neutral amino acid transporter 3-like isoform X2 [Alosa alosa]|uniref:sodium-coupled neutral amino acid transporter 3-like isoform X3 n=1 Tax=Alosa sapidissima TaxID=34773 RepID=UPI001C0952F7|nr:sodium-coupled neutral amino acid transporter 3-like isoform X3 [Alosa sapidissima]XP_048110817.1 sodium-coupled neutral amino acid transporter 3-like isoform X2 [Alosa alosa]